ncbi:MAG: polyprenyl synthetase family protein [Planctomycetota bacterium]
MRGVLELPSDLLPVQETMVDALARVEGVFDRAVENDLPPVAKLCAHVERYRGKMLRPALVTLFGLATREGADIGHAHDVLGAVCEMVHMATLVHDDVLDDADLRRRGATLNSLRGNEEAVILGDYLIASAYALCSSLNDPGPSRLIGATSRVLCSGELLQLHHRDDLSLDEATYFEILRMKTGVLIAASCQLGVHASGGTEEQDRAAVTFGERLGIAFQIQDDLLDLGGSEATVGKSVHKDIEKGKLTLPLIHHLRSAPASRRARTLKVLRSIAGGPDEATLADLRAALDETGSIDAARDRARHDVEEATRALKAFPSTPAKRVLELMARAVVDRAF